MQTEIAKFYIFDTDNRTGKVYMIDTMHTTEAIAVKRATDKANYFAHIAATLDPKCNHTVTLIAA